MFAFRPFLGLERLSAPPSPSRSHSQEYSSVTKTENDDWNDEEEDEDEDDVGAVAVPPAEPIHAASRHRSFRHVAIPTEERHRRHGGGNAPRTENTLRGAGVGKLKWKN